MSYLDSYGVGDARREKNWKIAMAAAVVLLIAGVGLYFFFRDRSGKQKVQEFLQTLQAGDYKAAYALWGCTDSTPCTGYPYEEFLKDWGPASPHSNAAGAQVIGGQHCSTGVIQVVHFPGAAADKNVQLWVEGRNNTIGFAPWPIDLEAARSSARARLRMLMRDLVGDCSPPPLKVP